MSLYNRSCSPHTVCWYAAICVCECNEYLHEELHIYIICDGYALLNISPIHLFSSTYSGSGRDGSRFSRAFQISSYIHPATFSDNSCDPKLEQRNPNTIFLSSFPQLHLGDHRTHPYQVRDIDLFSEFWIFP